MWLFLATRVKVPLSPRCLLLGFIDDAELNHFALLFLRRTCMLISSTNIYFYSGCQFDFSAACHGYDKIASIMTIATARMSTTVTATSKLQGRLHMLSLQELVLPFRPHSVRWTALNSPCTSGFPLFASSRVSESRGLEVKV